MTTSAAPSADPEAPSPARTGETPDDQRREWWRQPRRIVAACLAVALLTGGTTALVVVGDHRAAAKTAALDTLSMAAAAQVEVLEIAVEVSRTATTALAESDGQVADDQVRVTLAEAVSALDHAIASAQAVTLPTVDETTESITSAAVAAQDVNDELGAATQTTRDDLQAVLAAQQEWQLDEATSAYETTKIQLADLVTSSSDVLGGTDGRVADDHVRVSLREALASSTGLLDSEPDLSTVERITDAGTAVTQSITTLTSSTIAVQDATTAWTADEVRRQSAQETAAHTSRPPTSGMPTTPPYDPTHRSDVTPSGEQTVQNPSPPSPAPQPEWTIIEEDVPFEFDQCGDTSGNVWDC